MRARSRCPAMNRAARASARRVVPELLELLRAAAGDRDLAGPLLRGRAVRQLEDGQAARDLRPRIDLAGGRAIGGHEHGVDGLLDAAAEHVYAGGLRLLDDGMGL